MPAILRRSKNEVQKVVSRAMFVSLISNQLKKSSECAFLIQNRCIYMHCKGEKEIGVCSVGFTMVK